MQDLAGKTAIVTGAASGIGFALGRKFAETGMKVMLADIEADALTAAVESLHDFRPNVRDVRCDVADPVSVERAAKATYEAFGNVHVVCNNAGVGGGSGIDNVSLDTWRWVIDVNLMGVLHGIRTFLPHIRAHGEGGHIVNTASEPHPSEFGELREQFPGGARRRPRSAVPATGSVASPVPWREATGGASAAPARWCRASPAS